MENGKAKEKCTHGKTWYCSQCSKIVLTVYFLNQKNSVTGKIKPTYFYSSLAYDKKGNGERKLMEIVEANKQKIQSYLLYNNNPRTLIQQGNF